MYSLHNKHKSFCSTNAQIYINRISIKLGDMSQLLRTYTRAQRDVCYTTNCYTTNCRPMNNAFCLEVSESVHCCVNMKTKLIYQAVATCVLYMIYLDSCTGPCTTGHEEQTIDSGRLLFVNGRCPYSECFVNYQDFLCQFSYYSFNITLSEQRQLKFTAKISWREKIYALQFQKLQKHFLIVKNNCSLKNVTLFSYGLLCTLIVIQRVTLLMQTDLFTR